MKLNLIFEIERYYKEGKHQLTKFFQLEVNRNMFNLYSKTAKIYIQQGQNITALPWIQRFKDVLGQSVIIYLLAGIPSTRKVSAPYFFLVSRVRHRQDLEQ